MIDVGSRVRIKHTSIIGSVLSMDRIAGAARVEYDIGPIMSSRVYSLADLELYTQAQASTATTSNRFQVGQKVKALIDGPGHVKAGNIVDVVKVFMTSISGDNEFMYEHDNPVGSKSTYTGIETNFAADLNTPQPHPAQLGNQTYFNIPRQTDIDWSHSHQHNKAQPSQKHQCDCGGAAAETTHAFWCTTHNKETND